MKSAFQGWGQVAGDLRVVAHDATVELNDGQRRSLCRIAERLPDNGLVIADEVGMGKTRIACTVAQATIAAGGRVAVLVPPGLGYQWRDELKKRGVSAPSILRSLQQFRDAWKDSAPPRPWFTESCLIVSHAFTNWRLGSESEPWRWAMLPELYAHWVRARQGEFPDNYTRKRRLKDPSVKSVKNAAESIATAILAAGPRSRGWWLAERLVRHTPWPGALEAFRYERGGELRHWLEQAVGLGLGVFDLVIIDEAHKSRGEDSGLSRLLDGVVLQAREGGCRRMALTATPVELEMGQWQQTLSRIGVGHETVQGAISGYATAVHNVRLTPRDADARHAFMHAAATFQEALSPYLIRRDKREEAAVKSFARHMGEDHNAYRELTEMLIKPMNLAPAWKQSVCAAEALSFVARQADDGSSKRLRLTFGNGHGISTLIDELQRTTFEDGEPMPSSPGDAPVVASSGDKRAARVAWWRQVMAAPFAKADASETALYDHPGILRAVDMIERVVADGEKVLVFGRFTRPMRALVNLLNAREMLRVLGSSEGYWPQRRIHDDEWLAVRTAHRQLKLAGEADRPTIDVKLAEQYNALEKRREAFRNSLLTRLGRGLSRGNDELRKLFEVLEKAVAESDERLPTIARALSDHLGDADRDVSDEDLAVAFADLVLAAGDSEANEDQAKDASDEEFASQWAKIEERVRDEYARTQGGHARLMHGETEPATRRLLQLAFNRKNASLRVLVAQSVVGREGLNLHKACRTVLLLHPEWNPGVVEQQIGRVDRLGSLWEQLLTQALEDGDEPERTPRIRVWPVVFEGTYDETNWRTLKARWDELRAQLHGVVLTYDHTSMDDELRAWIGEINRAAPNFSPPPLV